MKSCCNSALFLAPLVGILAAYGQQAETRPVALRQPLPDYGPELSKYYLTDPLTVQMVIDSRGVPVELSTPDSIPDNFVEALSEWRFEPGKRNGNAVPFSLGFVVQLRRPILSDGTLGNRWYPASQAVAKAIVHGTGLDVAGAARLEEELKLDLNNEEKRSLLLLYATELASSHPDEATRLRARHLGWLVQNLPNAAVLSSPLALINNMAGPLKDPDGYQEIRKLWLDQLANAPHSPDIIKRVTNFLRVSDPEKAEEILSPAAKSVRGASTWLGELYGFSALGTTGVDLLDGMPVTAGEHLPDTAFAHKARTAMLLATDAHIVLGAALAFTEGGQALTKAKQLPQGYDALCAQLLMHTREIYPETKISCDPSAPPHSDSRPVVERLRIGGNVQAAQLIKKVQPIYPEDAKERRMQGKIEFNAIIAKDGTIQSLELISGPLAFYKSARKAVSQWEYKPTLLNGAPVEVVTRIDVNYTLSR